MAHPRVSFFTPGRRLPYGDSYIIVDHSYVQYIPPSPTVTTFRDRLPILFIHGGGLTGASWESTPDLRPGWAILAAQTGYPVYITDTVDSGRSARAPDSLRTGEVEHRTAKEVWSRFRFGPEEKFGELGVYEGCEFPIECFDVLLAGQAARRRTTDIVEMKGIIEAIKMVGPCWVIAHSHGAALLINVLSEVKDLVKQAVLVEPGGTSLAKKLTGDVRTLVVWGDYLENYADWGKIAEPFEKAPVELLKLPDVGIKGNTHFPMSDRNNNEILERCLEWLESCPKP